MPTPNELSRAAIVLAALLPGCIGELGELPAVAPLDGGPDLEPGTRWVEVADARAVSLDGTCIALEDGERLLDVTAEGDAWLATAGGVRVVAPSGQETARIAMRAGAPDRGLALSDTTAIVFAAGHAFGIESGSVHPIALPPELGAPQIACGDPGSDRAPFLMATTEGLYARESGVWARWTLDGSSLFAMGALAQESGACSDATGELWVRDEAGPVRVRDDASTRAPELEDANDLVREGGVIAARRDGAMILRISDDAPFETLRFDVGAITAVTLGAGQVWAIAGDELVRRATYGAWARASSGLTSVEAIGADQTGGVWVAGSGRACRLSSEPALRMRGLRASEVVLGDRPITLEVDGTAAALELRIDGEVVFEIDPQDTASRWRTPSLPLGGPGWHRLEVIGTIAATELRRTLEYRVADDTGLSWEADIRPDFDAHCASCHGAAGPQTNLGSVETYREFARVIRDRMALGEMPPTATGVPTDVVDRMTQWIEGGMQP